VRRESHGDERIDWALKRGKDVFEAWRRVGTISNDGGWFRCHVPRLIMGNAPSHIRSQHLLPAGLPPYNVPILSQTPGKRAFQARRQRDRDRSLRHEDHWRSVPARSPGPSPCMAAKRPPKPRTFRHKCTARGWALDGHEAYVRLPRGQS